MNVFTLENCFEYHLSSLVLFGRGREGNTSQQQHLRMNRHENDKVKINNGMPMTGKAAMKQFLQELEQKHQ